MLGNVLKIALIAMSVMTDTGLALAQQPAHPNDHPNGQNLGVNQIDKDISNAVDFEPGCKMPSAIYKTPDSQVYDPAATVGHSFVLLYYVVTPDGRPVDVHVDSGSSSQLLAMHALQQFDGWKFTPAVCNGKIVPIKAAWKWEYNTQPNSQYRPWMQMQPPAKCPPNGCIVPEAPINPAIAGLRLPKPPAPSAPAPPSRDDLIQERQRALRLVKSVDDMLSTRSFIARVRIACRSQQVAFPLLPNLGTVEDVETFYNQLMEQQSRPDPYLLQAKRGLLDSAYENMNVCQGEVINYGRKLPTDDEERDIAVRAKARIEEIDKALASPK